MLENNDNIKIGKNPIKIGHFINPHMFWFRYDIQEHNANIAYIEFKVKQYFNTCSETNENDNLLLKNGDIVAVHLILENLYVRAKIHQVDRHLCNLWAIDYGYPIISEMCNIKKLPRNIANLESICYNAGVDGVIPSKLIYSRQNEIKTVLDLKMWCSRSIEESKKLINSAGQAMFVLTSKTNIVSSIVEMNTIQLFGQLKLTNKNGKTVDLAQHLQFLNLARDSTSYVEIIRLMQFNIFSIEPVVKNFQSIENGEKYETLNDQPYQSNTELSCNSSDKNDKVTTALDDKDQKSNLQNIDVKANRITDFLLKRNKIREEKINDSKKNISTTENSLTNILNQNNPESEKQTNYNSSIQSLSENSPNDYDKKKLDDNKENQLYIEAVKSINIDKNLQNLQSLTETNVLFNAKSSAVLVHCKGRKTSIESVSRANFTREVHKELECMQIDNIYRIQTFSWPHLMRGNSLIIINSDRTGRTLSYLPSICSLIQMHGSENRITNCCGPIAIIVCSSSFEVEDIACICRRFFKNNLINFRIIESYGVRNYRSTSIQLLNNCEILISTPSSLVRLLGNQIKLIHTKRLGYLIFDDVDVIDQKDILHKLIPTCNDPSSVLSFQLIVIAKSWHNYMEKYLKMSYNPMICIGDFIEAAVYSRASININLTTNSTKMSKIIAFLDKHPHNREKLIIVCNTDIDVNKITMELTTASYPCISYFNSSTADELLLINEWKGKTLNSEILICTDTELQELNISNAQNLINFSLPSSWTRFKYRFSTLLENYHDRIINIDITNKKKVVPECLILLDEDNTSQLPKLIDFMELHNQMDCVPLDIQHLTNQIKIKREEERIQTQTIFCSRLLEFGSCTSTNCTYRHILSKTDESNSDIPDSGKVKLQILNIISPIHYNVRLIEHTEVDNKNWHYIRRSNEFSTFSFELALHMGSVENQKMYWPLEKNDLCAYEKDNVFYRCQILCIDSPKEKLSMKIETVLTTVRLIDDGRIINCHSSRLFTLPKEFQSFPFQAVDLRLSGLVPYDNEHVWDSKCTNIINAMLERKFQPGDSFIANIQFTLMNIIWVDHLILMEKIIMSRLIYKLNIKSMILKKQIATKGNLPTEVIQSLAERCGILSSSIDTISKNEIEPDTQNCELTLSDEREEEDWDKEEITLNIPEIDKKPIINNTNHCNEKIVEKWATLEKFEYIKVFIGEFYTPHSFYIQNIDTSSMVQKLDKMHEFIADYQLKNPVPIKTPIILENCISLFEEQFCRAQITKIICDELAQSPKIQIFFCDIGCSMITSLEDVYESSKEIIEYMPFQAICCKLIGINSKTNNLWVDEISETIYSKLLSQSKYTFIYAIQELTQNNALDFNTYDVIILNCDGKTELNINKEIVSQGWADYDNDTKHYLDLVINRSFIYDSHNIETEENHFSENMKTFNVDVEFQEDEILSLMNIKEKGAKILPITDDITKENEIADNNNKCNLEKKTSTVELIKSIDDKSRKDKKKIKRIKNQKTHSLTAEYKAPHTIWYQNESYIVLKISAPDLEYYTMHITDFELVFNGVNNLERNVLIINFLGTINSQISYYQIRGINMIVWLQKGISGLTWPRLTLEADKWYWLTNETTLFETIESETTKLPTFENLQISEESDLEDDDSDTNDDPFFDG